MSGNKDVYREVSEKIIQCLERGTLPWVRPWNSGVAINAMSGRAYRGVNILMTALHQAAGGYASPGFLTFNQVRQLGGWVRRGEKGVRIVAYRPVDARPASADTGDTENDEPASPWFIVRTFTVFNLEQCGGVDELARELAARPAFAPLEACEALVVRTQARIDATATRAFYRRSDDTVYIPPRTWFADRESYYATLFHELAHWTGAPHRLDRQGGGRFGDPRYAFEELVAEMASAFVCARAGIPHIDQAAAYLESWLSALRSDRRIIFWAAKAATAAADYLSANQTDLEVTAVSGTAPVTHSDASS